MPDTWSSYLQASLEKPLHPLWKEIDPHLRPGMKALDLGCGAGSGTLHMIELGLSVLAVDYEPEAIEITRSRLPAGANVHLLKSQFQDLGLEPESLDAAIAQFSLFFLRSWEFTAFWRRLVSSLRPGGIFAGQFLGVNDDWADDDHAHQSREEVANLLKTFDVLYLEEVDRDGETMLREPKHWHVFHVVAQKKTG